MHNSSPRTRFQVLFVFKSLVLIAECNEGKKRYRPAILGGGNGASLMAGQSVLQIISATGVVFSIGTLQNIDATEIFHCPGPCGLRPTKPDEARRSSTENP